MTTDIARSTEPELAPVPAPCVIDTHCHLDARELAHDVDAVRLLARARGVAQLVIPAVDVHNFGAVQAKKTTNSMIQAIISGQKDVATATKDAAAEMTDLLNK